MDAIPAKLCFHPERKEGSQLLKYAVLEYFQKTAIINLLLRYRIYFKLQNIKKVGNYG